MGIAAPPSQPGQTTRHLGPTSKAIIAATAAQTPPNGRPHPLTSMSQGFHQGSIFSFSDGFDRSSSAAAAAAAAAASQEQQHHVAQQSRRDKLRVQGFDPGTGHPLLQFESDEAGGTGIYEHTPGASNMLSEMFNFPTAPQPPTGPSASELLASQMSAGYGLALRPTPPMTGLSGDSWYGGGAVARQGMVLGGTNLGSIAGETSSPKQHGAMPGLGPNSAAAMHLFLMNPPQPHQQQQSRSPPSPPPPDAPALHQQAFQAFGNAASFGGGAGGGGAVEGQGLSLSLSSSLQQLEMAKAEDLRVRDGVLYFNSQQQQAAAAAAAAQLPQALQGHVGPLGQQLHVGYGPAGVAGVLRNSKYARAAQELLEEFCSVGRGQFKGGGRCSGRPRAGSSSNPNPKNGGGGASSSAGGGQSSSSACKDVPPLSPADRFEHQRKKAKLISMLDEVDRRYNHYCDQMQMVVNFFDSVMGFGAATPYTALAQKAMSRHFRCLKDAIAAQLRQTCELLGEKDAGMSSGLTKGETPRLRLLDQSLRQQRAFHHMGMMEQEAWRPQRGLPERSVNILRAWLFEHFLHPYPSDADKHLLARQTGLSRNQVSNWFINARVRLWKPMIEEMYQQESKDANNSGGAGAADDSAGPSASADTANAGASHTQATAAPHRQHEQAGTSGGPYKTDPAATLAGPPGAADSVLISIDPVELLGGDASVGPATDDIYRYGPAARMRLAAAAAAAASGDVSLTLGLQQAGGGNVGPDGSGRGSGGGRFSLRDYSGC